MRPGDLQGFLRLIDTDYLTLWNELRETRCDTPWTTTDIENLHIGVEELCKVLAGILHSTAAMSSLRRSRMALHVLLLSHSNFWSLLSLVSDFEAGSDDQA